MDGMDQIRVRGGRPLQGEIRISGAKNAALPLMAASLLTNETLTLTGVPHLADISTLANLLVQHGVEFSMNGEGAVCDGRELALTAAYMVGHSYGGAVAVRLALAHPEILGRLVLIEPVLTPLLNLDGREDIFEEYRLMAQAFLEYGRRDDDEAAWQGFIDYRNGAGAWAALPEKARSSSALARGRQWTRSFRTSPIKHRWTIAGRFRYRR